ncbi:hypothetical protein IWQ60_002241 [Tieghemiomyces parasiticus]|uniref:Telomerase reverse transcriptase n=1 Tax=Tieghemiomyces parasiticus TaxID=78921 RepID=A0A9W8AD16_9FUNG|nr:hypothetical protein IWQ60_002241 [Tieghemiomyces parasiticus]
MARRRRRGREAAKLIATSKPAEFQSKAAFLPRVPTGTVVASLQGHGPADTRRKSHWRLRRLRPLARRLFAKYQRCNLYAILARWCSVSSAQPKCSACPARVPDLPVSIQRISNTADLTSTTTRLIERSPNPTASGVGPNPKIRSGADKGVAGISPKPPTPPAIDFLSHRCNHHRVTFFLHTVLHSIVPQPLWGSPANRRAICRFISRFISAPLGDVFTMSDLLSGLRVEDFHWALFSPRSTRLPRAHRVSALRKAQELVLSFLWWLIEGLVIPLVQGFFYVTESAETRLHLLYYRHDTWRRLTHPTLRATLDHMYRTVPTNQLVATFARRKLGCASLRLMPKRNGLRLITNYSARNVRLVAPLGAGSTDIRSVISERSINFDLREVFRVLLYERERRPEMFASSVFGMSEVYTRLLAYKRRFGLPLNELVSSDTPGFFYMVKTDVHRAFDHIPQTRLLELLDDLLGDDEYLVRTYRRIGDTARGPRARYLQVGSDGDTFLPFPVFAAAQARRTQNSAVYVDDVVHGYHLRDDLLGLIREHISDNLIRVGDRRFYRQVVGIPQGSVVSSFLCNLFLSALETRHLAEFHTAPALLLRLTDDFLLITPDRAQAQRFYHRVCAQFPDFGCQFNPHKTLTNFDVGLSADLGPAHRVDIGDGRQYEGFPWCGLRIDPVTLDVHTDYTRYHDHRLRDTVTLPCQLNSAQALAGKLRLLIYGRLDDLRLSLDLLTPRSVLINVYENFVLNALRFCALLRKLPRPVPTASWLADLVGQCVDETARYINRYHRRQLQARGQAGNPTRLSLMHHQW